MAEPFEGVAPPGNTEDKSKTEFLNRVKKVKSEIKTKFQKVRKELDDQELNILKRVEDIEQEILENYGRASVLLKEINQGRENLLANFKSNETNTLLKKSLEIFDKEIEDIKQNSKIDSTIELVWKMEKLVIPNDVCEVTINTYTSNSPQFPSNPESDRNAGNYQPKSEYPDIFRDTFHSHTPRGSPSESGLNQARPAYEMSPIEEGNQGRYYSQYLQIPVDPQSSASIEKNKRKLIIPPPTKIDDTFQLSAFTQGATQGLYNTQPSIPPPKTSDPYNENTLGRNDNLSVYQPNLPGYSGSKAEDYLPPPIYRPHMPSQTPLLRPSNIPSHSSPNHNFGKDQHYHDLPHRDIATNYDQPILRPEITQLPLPKHIPKSGDVNPRKKSFEAYYPNQPRMTDQNAPTPDRNFNPYPSSNNDERDDLNPNT